MYENGKYSDQNSVLAKLGLSIETILAIREAFTDSGFSQEDFNDVSHLLAKSKFSKAGTVVCGVERCTRFRADTEKVELTLDYRDDGFCAFAELLTPDGVFVVTQESPLFGPVDEGLFDGP
jgi:hypothetical protein